MHVWKYQARKTYPGDTDMAQRPPEKIGDILGELMARTGYARVQGSQALEMAWQRIAGELAAQYTRVTTVRRGKLEVIAANSVLVQELTFRKAELIKQLAGEMPEAKINDIRFKVGRLS